MDLKIEGNPRAPGIPYSDVPELCYNKVLQFSLALLTGHDSVVIAIVVKNFLAFFDGSYGADHSIGAGIFLEIIITILTITYKQACKVCSKKKWLQHWHSHCHLSMLILANYKTFEMRYNNSRQNNSS